MPRREEQTEDIQEYMPPDEESQPSEQQDSLDDELNYDEDDDSPIRPEDMSVALYKYQVTAELPISQKKELDSYRVYYGRHAALGNTERFDNLHYIDSYDLTNILDKCPTLRHRALRIKGRSLSEMQICRSNPPVKGVGGYERSIEQTAIHKRGIEITDNRIAQQEKKKRFHIFGRK